MLEDEKQIALSFKTFIKWSLLSIIVGLVVGFIAALFCMAVNWATSFRSNHLFIVFLLPLAGILIVLISKLFHDSSNIDTVMGAITSNKKVPIALAPVIMLSTFISHLFGASVGREGAALQLGGSLGEALGKIFKLDKKDKKIIIMSGMSAAFSALFGTPIAAAIFPIAFVKVGNYQFSALLPCMFSSLIANEISLSLGNTPESFLVDDLVYTSGLMILKIIPIALLAGLISAIFCKLLFKSGAFMKETIKNPYLRIIFGAILTIILALTIQSADYLGGGIPVIEEAFDKTANPSAFILKMLFTCIAVSTGFKGGEIVPSFFIGATLGSALSPLVGLPIDVCAACGLISVFCGVTNAPLTSIIMAIELFGAEGLPFYGISIAISFVISGYYSLYKNQQFAFSKYKKENSHTKAIDVLRK